MEQTFTCTTAYTESVLKEANRRVLLHVRRHSMVLTGIAGAAAVLLVLWAAALDVPKGGYTPSWVVLWFVPLVAIALTFKPYWQGSSAGAGQHQALVRAGLPLDMTYTFDGEGLTMRHAQGWTRYQWRQCTAALETRTLQLLCFGGSYVIIDLRGFEPAQVQPFLAFLSARLDAAEE